MRGSVWWLNTMNDVSRLFRIATIVDGIANLSLFAVANRVLQADEIGQKENDRYER